jgi:hypothetical protein
VLRCAVHFALCRTDRFAALLFSLRVSAAILSPAHSIGFARVAPVHHYGAAYDLARRHHSGRALLLNQNNNKLRRFGLTCVPPNDVNIIRTFIKGLTGC